MKEDGELCPGQGVFRAAQIFGVLANQQNNVYRFWEISPRLILAGICAMRFLNF